MTDLERLESKVECIQKDVIEIRTALKGYNGLGLIPAFEAHCKADEKFRKIAFIIFGILIGSGVLTVSILQVIG